MSESLARGVLAAPGAVVALTVAGRFSVGPAEGREVSFGRNRPRWTCASARTTCG